MQYMCSKIFLIYWALANDYDTTHFKIHKKNNHCKMTLVQKQVLLSSILISNREVISNVWQQKQVQIQQIMFSCPVFKKRMLLFLTSLLRNCTEKPSC